MARVKNNCDYNNPFAVRLRELIDEKGVKHREVAENIGVTRQTVGQYADGTTLPTLDKLLKMAEYFDVPLDYIAGTGKAKSKNADIAAACDYLGVSEKTVNGIKNNIDKMNWMSKYILESEELANMALESFFDSSELLFYEIAKSVVDKRLNEDLKVVVDSEASQKHKSEMYFNTALGNNAAEFTEFLIYKEIISFCEMASKNIPSFLTEEQKQTISNSKNIGEVLCISLQSKYSLFARESRKLIEEYFGEEIKAIIKKELELSEDSVGYDQK